MTQWIERVSHWFGILGFDSESDQTNDSTLVFATSLLNVQHRKGSVHSKPVSLLVGPFEKALNGMPPMEW